MQIMNGRLVLSQSSDPSGNSQQLGRSEESLDRRRRATSPWSYSMSLIRDLLERPGDLTITSKYTVLNGVIYLGIGALVVIWPGMVQTIFRDAAFVGNEA